MKDNPCIDDNILNSRDIDNHIDFLKIGLDDTPFDVDEYSNRLREIVDETPEEWWEGIDKDEVEELINWLELRDEAREYTSEWRYGTTLIEESHFEEYAKEFAKEIGAFPPEMDETFINWEAYVDSLRQDYCELSEIDGHTYLVRTT